MENIGTACFEDLLSQLAAEHRRTIASLSSELARFRRGTNSDSIQQCTNCNVGTSSQNTDSVQVLRNADSVQAVDVAVASSQCENQVNQAKVSVKTSFSTQSKRRYTPSACELNTPTMNWQFAAASPRTQNSPSHLVSRIFLRLGISSDRVESAYVWWNTLEEPKRNGMCARVAESTCFHALSLIVVLLNTILISLATDYNLGNAQKDAAAYFQSAKTELIVEGAFTCYYFMEIVCKIFAHRLYFFIGKDAYWHMFDLLLVLFACFDITCELAFTEQMGDRPNVQSLRVLRVLKLARILRILRVVRSIQELRLLMDCILNSVQHLVWSVLLILLFLFMFSLTIVQGLVPYVIDHGDDEIPEEYKEALRGFSTVSSACVSLFMATSGGWDWKDLYYFVSELGGIYRVIFIFYITFFVIAVWNIVLATFVEKAFRLALPDLETVVMQKRQERMHVATELEVLLSSFDDDHDGFISKDEFRGILKNGEIKDFFEARDIDLKDVELFFNMVASTIGSSSPRVPLSTFVNTCTKMRGLALNVDLQSFHFDFRRHVFRLDHKLGNIERLMKQFSALGKTFQVDNANAHQDTPTLIGL